MTRRSGDPILRALEAMAQALDVVAHEQRHLADQLEGMHASRAGGMTCLEILTTESGEGSIQLVSQLLARVSQSSGVMRRAVVEELRHEGASIPEVARLLGVSHQRVSNLLRRSTAPASSNALSRALLN